MGQHKLIDWLRIKTCEHGNEHLGSTKCDKFPN
jgi:hypothetical protein